MEDKLFNKYRNLNPIELIKEAKKKVSYNDIKEIEEPFLVIKEIFNKVNKNEFLKIQFNELEKIYLKKKQSYLKGIEDKLNKNLELKKEIISDIKSILNSKDPIHIKKRKVASLQDKWESIGQVKKKYSHQIWQTYKHNLNNFYNYVSLNREAMNIYRKKNYEYKNDLISELKNIIENEDNIETFIYTQKYIINKWKLTRKSDDAKDLEIEFNKLNELAEKKKEKYSKTLFIKIGENINKVKGEIQKLEKQKNNSIYKEVKMKIEGIEYLIQDYILISNKIEENKKDGDDIIKYFNNIKNNFFKDLKQFYKDNLNKKTKLLENLKNIISKDEDILKTSTIVKKMQKDWKGIGNCLPKQEQNIWNEFNGECNKFFDRLKLYLKTEQENMEKNIQNKEALLKELQKRDLKDEKEINGIIQKWNSLGKVHKKDWKIEDQFNKLIDGFYEKLNLNKDDLEMNKFKSKIDLILANNANQLNNEKHIIVKNKNFISREINKLETNLSFFTISKNSQNIKFIDEIKNKIIKMKEDLSILEKKLNYIKSKTK